MSSPPSSPVALSSWWASVGVNLQLEINSALGRLGYKGHSYVYLGSLVSTLGEGVRPKGSEVSRRSC